MLDAADRIAELVDKIKYYNQKYYVEHLSEIPDHEYDHLMTVLKSLEADHPDLIRSDSPTQHIGETVSDTGKHIPHRERMLSIDNVYSESEIFTWGDRVRKKIPNEKIEWVCELKIDGIAASLLYENGEFRQALTRGDGVYGDDITPAVQLLVDIPKKLEGITGSLEVRGEIYMENSELVRINLDRAKRGEDAFANTRNITAGTVKNQNPTSIEDRHLRFFAHSTGSTKELTADNHFEFMGQLESLGFHTSPFLKKVDTLGEAVTFCRNFIPEIYKLDFEIDGFVIKVNNFAQREKIGGTPKYPHWVIAYKFEKYEAQTKIRDIVIQVGKTGTITPVAELEPVEIAGTIVSRTSLHNAEEIARKDVRVGDTVIVEKAGKIIPHLVRVEKHLREKDLPVFRFPEVCPGCGSELKKDEGGVFIRCTNINCIAQFREKLEYFASRNAMNIDGFGPTLIAQLTTTQTQGLLTMEPLVLSFVDLYRLTEEDICNLERRKDKSAKKLIQAIQASKTRGPARLLNALSIRGIGEETSRLLVGKYHSIDRIKEAAIGELAAIPSIGEKLAANIYEYFHSEYGLKTLMELKAEGVVMELSDTGEGETAMEEKSGILSGLSICVTGTLIRCKRDDLKERILAQGGLFTSSVTSKTNYLVASDVEKTGTKLQAARKLNIPILTEEEFFEKFPELQEEEEEDK